MKTTHPRTAALVDIDPAELLIKEAQQAARKRRLQTGAVAFAVLALIVAGLLIAATNGKSPSANGNAPGVFLARPCPSSALRVSAFGFDAAAGSVAQLFEIHNVSASACALVGYPKIAFTSQNGAVETIRILNQHSKAGGLGGGLLHGTKLLAITLAAHSGVASFWIEGTDVGNGIQNCPSVLTTLVTPPGTTKVLQVPASSKGAPVWCGGHFDVVVTPVLAGKSGTYPSVPLHHFSFL